MKNKMASSPTESGYAGVSEPVTRKGIICSQAFFVGLRKAPSVAGEFLMGLCDGMEVDILADPDECDGRGFYLVNIPMTDLTGYVPSNFIREVYPHG